MLKPLLVLFSLILTTFAALNGRCSGSKATGDWKSDGICIRTSTCEDYGGRYKSGACPYDPDGVKCCIMVGCNGRPDQLGDRSRCTWTSDDHICLRWLDNKCPGGNNYKCCQGH